MTRVVLLGASPGPDISPTGLRLAALPGNPTVAERLRGQLSSMDPRFATVQTGDVAAALRAVADVAESATESLFLIPENSVVHDELIYQITKSKRGALALVAKEPRTGVTEDNGQEETGPEEPVTEDEGPGDRIPIDEAEPEIGLNRVEGLPVRVRIGKSRVVSVGTANHAVTRPNGVVLGPLHISARNAPVLAQTCRELADMAHRFGADDDLMQLIVFGLVRNGVSVGIRGRRDLFYRRVTTQEEINEAGAEMAGMDEDRSRLNNAVKGADGFFTTYFVSTYSRYIARWAARRGLTPNQVTLISIALGVAAAACFATGDRPWMVAGGVLIYFAFVFDCVDGQVARYARKFGVLGGMAGRHVRPVQGIRRLRRPGHRLGGLRPRRRDLDSRARGDRPAVRTPPARLLLRRRPPPQAAVPLPSIPPSTPPTTASCGRRSAPVRWSGARVSEACSRCGRRRASTALSTGRVR
ncbi:CDP-alcohol phosphatidyltransferase family protein [Nonomuraea salmonea]|uniref:CDP-alcohol phosphatidyltransferase family protein n=1 Tax=Nonomuraea salmonea TaxID=46181 RepID=UPI002FEDB13E